MDEIVSKLTTLLNFKLDKTEYQKYQDLLKGVAKQEENNNNRRNNNNNKQQQSQELYQQRLNNLQKQGLNIQSKGFQQSLAFNNKQQQEQERHQQRLNNFNQQNLNLQARNYQQTQLFNNRQQQAQERHSQFIRNQEERANISNYLNNLRGFGIQQRNHLITQQTIQSREVHQQRLNNLQLIGQNREITQARQMISLRQQQLRLAQQTANAQHWKIRDGLNSAQQLGQSGFDKFKGGILGSLFSYGDLEEQLIRASVKSGASEQQTNAMKEQAKRLGFETRFSSLDVAKSQNYLAGQNYNPEQIIKFIPHVLDVAGINKDDPNSVAKLMTEMLHQNRMAGTDENFKSIANLVGVARGKMGLELEQIRYSMKYAGALGHIAGIKPTEQMAVAIGLGRAGLLGSTPGTSMRAILADMSNLDSQAYDPTTKERSKKTRKQIYEENNIQAFNKSGQFDLQLFATSLAKALEGRTNQGQMSLLSQIFGKTSLTAGGVIGGLAHNGKDGQQSFLDILKILKDTNITDLSKKTNTGVNFKIDQLTESIKTLAITIGEQLAPILTPIIEKITDFINWIGQNPHLVTLISRVLMLGTVMTGLAVAVSSVSFFMFTLAPLFNLIRAVSTGLISVFARFGTQILFVNGGLLSLIGAVTKFALSWAILPATIYLIFDDIIATLQGKRSLGRILSENINQWLKKIGIDLTSFWDWFYSFVTGQWIPSLTSAFDGFFSMISSAWNNLKSLFGGGIQTSIRGSIIYQNDPTANPFLSSANPFGNKYANTTNNKTVTINQTNIGDKVSKSGQQSLIKSSHLITAH